MAEVVGGAGGGGVTGDDGGWGSHGEAGGKYTAALTFRGCRVSLLQEPRDKTADGQDNTGWCVWECSNIALRYIADDGRVAALVAPPPAASTHGATPPPPSSPIPFSSLSILDLSAGAGLIALACAAAGARVVATDVPAQLPQLIRNVERAHAAHAVTVLPLFWGQPLDAVAAAAAAGRAASGRPPFDLAIASDILFIALRDGRTAELTATLTAVCQVATAVLFAFEERLFREEDAYMVALGAAGSGVEVREVGREHTTVPYDESLALQGAGGHPDTDLWNPHLFWEPPPVRMFILTAAPGRD